MPRDASKEEMLEKLKQCRRSLEKKLMIELAVKEGAWKMTEVLHDKEAVGPYVKEVNRSIEDLNQKREEVKMDIEKMTEYLKTTGNSQHYLVIQAKVVVTL